MRSCVVAFVAVCSVCLVVAVGYSLTAAGRSTRSSSGGRQAAGPVGALGLSGGSYLGFVGTRIVHALRAEDRAVRVLARDPKDAETVAAWGCEVAEGDMTDAASLRRAVAGCEALIDLVAIISGSR